MVRRFVLAITSRQSWTEAVFFKWLWENQVALQRAISPIYVFSAKAELEHARFNTATSMLHMGTKTMFPYSDGHRTLMVTTLSGAGTNTLRFLIHAVNMFLGSNTLYIHGSMESAKGGRAFALVPSLPLP